MIIVILLFFFMAIFIGPNLIQRAPKRTEPARKENLVPTKPKKKTVRFADEKIERIFDKNTREITKENILTI